MLKHSLAVFLIVASTTLSFAQDHWKQPKLTAQTSNTTQLLISVSPVNSRIVWAAGTGGTYVVTTDGGETWKAAVVPGAESLQFRDVQGVSDKIAYLLSIGTQPDRFSHLQNYRWWRHLDHRVQKPSQEGILRLLRLLSAGSRNRAQ